jgi:hypothetical protein
MPTWGLFLLGFFVFLGLRARPKWNVNALAVGVTILVVLGVAASDHLI